MIMLTRIQVVSDLFWTAKMISMAQAIHLLAVSIMGLIVRGE
jgi:hypothetical protein